jgi:HPt (histidine-containing phosphotransfer) domain-containing protein
MNTPATSREPDRISRIAHTIADAAASLGMPEQTFRDYVRNGEIAYVEYGNGTHKKRKLILPEDLGAWLLRRRVRSKYETEVEGDVEE